MKISTTLVVFALPLLALLPPSQAFAERISRPILDQGFSVVIEDVRQMPATSATPPFARINTLREAPDGSGRLFVCDMVGPLYVLRGGALSTYLDFRTLFPNLMTWPGLGTGFVGFAFHPTFATSGLFYTVHSEFAGSTPPNLVPAVPTSTPQHCVLVEWRATNPAADVFAGTRRELMRIAAVTPNHNLGVPEFNPNAAPGDPDYGLLYLASGDFGSVEMDEFTQIQRLDTVYGCVLRIDPLGTPFVRGGITFPYGIPPGNPFAGDGDPATFGEIYTWGHRNAHRLTWDTFGAGTLYASDIGESNLEELDTLEPGRNFGWPWREGTWALDPTVDRTQVLPLPPNDSTYGYSYPVAQFEREDGTAIAGGVAYRGPLGGLWGRFVFGDIVSGNMYYSYLNDLEAADATTPGTTAQVYRLTLMRNGQITRLLDLVRAAVGSNVERTDLRFATDRSGALYVTTKMDGYVRKIVAVSSAVAVSDPSRAPAPSVWPNPVRTWATVRLAAAATEPRTLEIHDLTGRRLRTMTVPAGAREARFRADDAGAPLAPGVYFASVPGGAPQRFVVIAP